MPRANAAAAGTGADAGVVGILARVVIPAYLLEWATMHIVPASTGMAEALRILGEGGVVAHATETCYGFACDLTNQKAVEKLFQIKQRSFDQPVSGLFVRADQAKLYTHWNDHAQELAQNYLPGPLTLILPLKKDPPQKLFPTPNGGTTIGVRISSHPIAQLLAKEFGLPLVTTSANLHGLPEPYRIEDMQEQFPSQSLEPDLVVDSGALPKTRPSTIVDLTGPDIRIVRQGSLHLTNR